MSTYQPIASITLASAASSVTFSGIPQTYTDLVLVAHPKLTSSNTDRLILQFNGDTGSNYSATYLQGDGSSASSGRFSSVTEMRFYNQSTSEFVPNIIHIQNYSNSTTNKTAIGRSSAAGISATATVGLWRSTAAITRVDVVSPNTWTSGSTFNLYGIANASITNVAKATGGDSVYTDGTYWYHIFRSSGVFTPTQALTCDYLVVAGGGGGGRGGGGSGRGGGGGGAGGYRNLASQSLTKDNAYTVTVGAGGTGAPSGGSPTSGSNSSLGSTSATGGGRAGLAQSDGAGASGASGGSGGGASATDSGVGFGSGGAGNAGSYSPVEGYAGGSISAYSTGGAGGGGSAAAGTSVSGSTGGAGGTGTANSISGSSVTYGVGGNGGNNSGTTAGTAGTANTGDGGGGGQGGATTVAGGNGGSGIVIVRYVA